MGATVILLALQWTGDRWRWWLYAPYLYFSVAAAVIAHNHNHIRLFHSNALNWVTDIWITLFYGFPAFGWIPTHNKNHHVYNNTAPDVTRTWRFWETNNAFTLLAYPPISSFFQQGPIRSYLKTLYRRDARAFWLAMSQVVALGMWIGVAVVLDWRRAIVYVLVPQQVSLTTILFLNYIQHVHADEESEWDHSRNFTGRVLNALLFNNGFHTVHHRQPGLHWSLAARAHAEIASNIAPECNEPSLLRYLVRTYLFAPFVPALRRQSPRLSRL